MTHLQLHGLHDASGRQDVLDLVPAASSSSTCSVVGGRNKGRGKGEGAVCMRRMCSTAEGWEVCLGRRCCLALPCSPAAVSCCCCCRCRCTALCWHPSRRATAVGVKGCMQLGVGNNPVCQQAAMRLSSMEDGTPFEASGPERGRNSFRPRPPPRPPQKRPAAARTSGTAAPTPPPPR